jgi:hypothetical protein
MPSGGLISVIRIVASLYSSNYTDPRQISATNGMIPRADSLTLNISSDAYIRNNTMNDWYSAEWMTREKLQSIREDVARNALHPNRHIESRKLPALLQQLTFRRNNRRSVNVGVKSNPLMSIEVALFPAETS